MKNVECRLNKVFEYFNSNDKLASVVKATQEKLKSTEQELRAASEALRADSSENRWVLVGNNRSVEEWISNGFRLVIKFQDGSVELTTFKPYGMTEDDRIRYFNETYMKEFGRGKTIDDLSQVAWFGIAYNVNNVMAEKRSDEFRFIFADYMKIN